MRAVRENLAPAVTAQGQPFLLNRSDDSDAPRRLILIARDF